MSKLRARKITQLRRIEVDDVIKAKAIAALLPHSSRVLAEMRLDTKAEDKFSEIFMQQPDLMYVEAVLVTEGINDNDDAFTHAELWRAQGTPILKPINLGHNDRNIIGVMYGVEARKIEDGTTMTEDDGSPFELVMHGVVWHYLPHIRNTASNLVEKFVAGNAFVSMECWFEGYNYGFYDQNGNFEDEIERCDDTAHLEKNLRVSGGAGRFNGRRIGRALTGITFGGVGIVDVPANRRSLMTDIFMFDANDDASVSASEELASVATDVNNNDNVVRNNIPEEGYMNDTTQKAVANAQPADVAEEVKKGVTVALSDRDRAEAEKRAQAELENVKAEAADLRGKLENSEKELDAVKSAVDEQFDALRVEAGATGDTPAEIKKIDDAIRRGGSGSEVMQAKISWIANSRSAASAALSEENDKLKAENEELRAKVRETVRTEEIQEVFADLLSAEELEATVKRGLAKSDEDYPEWLEEKKLFAAKMLDQMDPKKREEMKKKKGKAGNVVRRDDGGEVLQDHGVSLQPGHGRVPSSVPSPQSLASVDDINDLFEEVDDGNLAGADAGAEDDEPRKNPYEDIVTAMLKESKQERRRALGNNEGGN